jgi:hypothetical protein
VESLDYLGLLAGVIDKRSLVKIMEAPQLWGAFLTQQRLP